ncbi:MAG: hypothetical protein AB2552_21355 [Candidatus Thiodiazotropha endolucinida]
MNIKVSVYCVSAIAALLITTSASAEAWRSKVAFNNGIGEKTADQPANGLKVAYQVKLQGGELDGCTVDIIESLYGRDEGSWGIFDIAGDVSCIGGGFAYTSSGAWDGNGFHASGDIKEGSGRGDFEDIAGRIAQLGGAAAAAAAGDGTLDVSYELVVDKIND